MKSVTIRDCTLYNIDNTLLLENWTQAIESQSMIKFDAVITDPPYGIGADEAVAQQEPMF